MVTKKGFAGIIFLVIFVFAVLNVAYALEDGSQFISDISSGVTRTFYIGNVLGFDTLGGRHTFLLLGIKNGVANVKISEPSQTAAMTVGDEKRFDFNGDGIMDVYVKINDIMPSGVTNVANVTIQTIAEPAAPEVIEPEPAAPEPVAPAEEPQEILIDKITEPEKSSSTWIWIVAVVVVIAAALYFILRKRK
jgi:hypothetical protein